MKTLKIGSLVRTRVSLSTIDKGEIGIVIRRFSDAQFEDVDAPLYYILFGEKTGLMIPEYVEVIDD
jgi:hypothetical protein